MDASLEEGLMNEEEPGVPFPQEKPPFLRGRCLGEVCLLSGMHYKCRNKTGVVDLADESFLRIKVSCAFHEARGIDEATVVGGPVSGRTLSPECIVNAGAKREWLASEANALCALKFHAPSLRHGDRFPFSLVSCGEGFDFDQHSVHDLLIAF
ncbi:hypothetical protein CEXT_588501 [Caerostris extrusa]|uniref:Uncharacterized protein n=1 Tax=Caerostris extrusa TaxID=172846 RepID=A0AAV4UBS1_CAEEX|nr:hypothetical protein CEXT_588501 [Caerostris extrusa]